MAYTPPVYNNIEFVLSSGYTPPVYNDIDFVMGGEAVPSVSCEPLETASTIPNPTIVETAAPTIVDSEPLITTSTIKNPDVQIQLFCPALITQASLFSEILWYSILEELTTATTLSTVDIVLFVSCPSLNTVSSLTGSFQQRLRLVSLDSETALEITGISVVPDGTDVVSPWPLNTVSSLIDPDLEIALFCPPFLVDSSISILSVIAGDTIVISPPEFETTSSLSGDLEISIYGQIFETQSLLDLWAIQSAPTGDTYLAVLPFLVESELAQALLQAGIDTPVLSTESTLSTPVIFSGISITAGPFEVDSTVNASTEIGVSINPLNTISTLSAVISLIIDAQFNTTSTIPEITIYEGSSVEVAPFLTSSSITAEASFVIAVEPFEVASTLGAPDIERFVWADEFDTVSTLEVDDVKIIQITSEDVYYFFRIGEFEIPISSFQCRMRDGEPTFLQVTIPGFEYATELAGLVGEEMFITIAYKFEGTILKIKDIVSAYLETVASTEGASSGSIVLTGYKTTSYDTAATTIKSESYYRLSGGKFSYRLAKPSITLAPGAVVTIDNTGISFTAGMVSYSISTKRQYMEVTEA